MSSILQYLQEVKFPKNDGDANYTLLEGKLYKLGRASPMLHETIMVLEEVHQGACTNHIGGRALAYKLLKLGYY